MKLSIIIPAYNVEQYIGDCLESIFSQHIENGQLEVFVINDGSVDNTENIVKDYTNKHPNLIYIRQKNQGQSVARNVGLKRATGDYIWYVDSDDKTTDNSIQTIFSYMEKYPNADFLTFDNIYNCLLDGDVHYSKSWGGHKAKNPPYEKAFNGYEANEILKASVPWYHVFKRSFLISNNLYFTPGLLHEDDELRMRLFFFAKEVRYIPFAHYIYSGMRPGSLTAENYTFTLKSAESCMKTIEAWMDFEKKYVKTNFQRNVVNKSINLKYQSLMLLTTRKNEQDLYALYQEHHNEWKRGYKESFRKSLSFKTFSWIELIRYFVTFYCPQYLKYTEARTLKRLLKGE